MLPVINNVFIFEKYYKNFIIVKQASQYLMSSEKEVKNEFTYDSEKVKPMVIYFFKFDYLADYRINSTVLDFKNDNHYR